MPRRVRVHGEGGRRSRRARHPKSSASYVRTLRDRADARELAPVRAPGAPWRWLEALARLGSRHGPDLSGQVVAITGASSGIGEATALACAARGRRRVALAARRADRIEALAEAHRGRRRPARSRSRPTSATRTRRARSSSARTSELGRLDVLVNNAGVMLLGPIDGRRHRGVAADGPRQRLGVLYCTHAALPVMREQGGGHIVNVSSVAGRVAPRRLRRLQPDEVGRRRRSRRRCARRRSTPGIRVTIDRAGRGRDGAARATTATRGLEAIAAKRFEGIEPLQADDIADAIVYALGQPPHVSINEMLVRPSKQQG